MNIYLIIFILIVLSKILSILSKKINLPPFLSMILLGIMIGPTALNIIQNQDSIEILKMFSKIGLFILIFMAGLETNIEHIKHINRNSVFIAIGGIILPLILGYCITLLYTGNRISSIIMGFILTATSASITIMILMNIGKLVTVEGNTIANAAIIDDIIGFMSLSIITSIMDSGSFELKTVVFLSLANFLYFSFVFFIAILVVDFIKKKLSNFKISLICLVISAAFLLIFCMNLWKINFFTITGIYFAGLFLSKSDYMETIEESLKISQLIFVPVFFIFIGIGLDFKNLNPGFIPYIIAFIFIALFGKILGCGIIAKISGFDLKRSFRIGCGMTPRGELALIIASITFFYGSARFINEGDFISVIIMVTVTILVIQYLLKFLFRDKRM
jgi:Kef-type K+ transport system membrane component KefB